MKRTKGIHPLNSRRAQNLNWVPQQTRMRQMSYAVVNMETLTSLLGNRHPHSSTTHLTDNYYSLLETNEAIK